MIVLIRDMPGGGYMAGIYGREETMKYYPTLAMTMAYVELIWKDYHKAIAA